MISIHALRGEGDARTLGTRRADFCISIHALRGEGDPTAPTARAYFRHFNPRPPWGGRRERREGASQKQTFQSTPSVGRATVTRHISSHRQAISIHALRGEGDSSAAFPPWGQRGFQSTPSVGRATKLREPLYAYADISIHALRGEGDFTGTLDQTKYDNFNPRPPWGGRLRFWTIRDF